MSEELVSKEIAGTVTFANEVLEIIAGIAACDIPGVAGMSGGFKDGIADFLGRKNFTKGIKVTKNAESLVIDIQIFVEYGVRVPDVCVNIQKSVLKAIETMTGLKVTAINIFVEGIKFKEAASVEKEGKEEK